MIVQALPTLESLGGLKFRKDTGSQSHFLEESYRGKLPELHWTIMSEINLNCVHFMIFGCIASVNLDYTEYKYLDRI